MDKEGRNVHKYKIEHYHWRVRKVFTWTGTMEYMIEIDQLEDCVGYGQTLHEAKVELQNSLNLWLHTYGKLNLPTRIDRAQIITVLAPMNELEFNYINEQLEKIR